MLLSKGIALFKFLLLPVRLIRSNLKPVNSVALLVPTGLELICQSIICTLVFQFLLPGDKWQGVFALEADFGSLSGLKSFGNSSLRMGRLYPIHFPSFLPFFIAV